MLKPYSIFNVRPSLPAESNSLSDIAYNLWWAWHPEAQELFEHLAPQLWEESHHNPVMVLGGITGERLHRMIQDPDFQEKMHTVRDALRSYCSEEDTWYSHTHKGDAQGCHVAYFSMEYGLTECVPIYSGGLGVLSGDHLKTASDLGVPLVGVGLLYQQGYFRQYLNPDGWQREEYPINDFYTMPLELVKTDDDEPLTISVTCAGEKVVAQVWRMKVGRVPLYLLDTNLDVNTPQNRDITDKLYGGDDDMRVRQEIVLGIGGMRALEALNIRPVVCHMNEGHSAFLALERVRMAMEEMGLSFDQARALTAAGNVFTTHTAVPAGIDLFSPGLMEKHFRPYTEQLGLNWDAFLALGRPPEHGPNEAFSMAVFALAMSWWANGVSKLHGEIARKMWQNLWSGTPEKEVPIIDITNGVHHCSWMAEKITKLLTRHLGAEWAEHPEDESAWENFDAVTDEEIWNTHQALRRRLIDETRNRAVQKLQRHGATPADLAQAGGFLDPNVLTIGFARRVATYKRALLLFRDVDRLSRIINDSDRPIQIIFSGKAHPHDNPAKEYIRRLVRLSRRPDLRGRIVFLEDYDIELARYLVQGVDVWLNTPRRGMEASGTSGMKAAMNGVLHLSTLDGWWVEGYGPELGWSIGHGERYEDTQYGDAVEAQALYQLLEQEVIPLFYDRDDQGLPRGWISMMRNAIRQVTPAFDTQRMLEEYVERMYLPAAGHYQSLSQDDGQEAKNLADWRQRVAENWSDVEIVEATSDTESAVTVRDDVQVHARVRLGALMPEDVVVQVCYGQVDNHSPLQDYHVIDMTLDTEDEEGDYVYSAPVRFEHIGLSGYTVRVLPHHDQLPTPHLEGLVRWAS